MLDRIIQFSLKNKLAILLGAAILIAVGTYTTMKMEIDVFPDLTAPTVVIMTEAEGMTSEEVERVVTFPIETAVNGTRDVRRLRSVSMQGYSMVWVEFDWGVDIFQARQHVSEKMVAIGENMPESVKPMLAPQSSLMGEIMFVGITSDSLSSMDLRTTADWSIKPAILATSGVSQVTVMGGDTKQYRLLADPIRMNYYNVTMDELEEVGHSFTANAVGGILREYGNEYAVKGVARTNDLEEMGNTFVKEHNEKPIVLSDVADITIGPGTKYGYASLNGKPGVIISISKQPGVNTLELTRRIEQCLEETKATLPVSLEIDSSIFRQSDFIETSVNNIERALIEGALLVILVLFLFLGSFRTTLISVIAIPLSLFATIIVMKWLNMNINTMTLGGMCIAIGSLVDDAIIDVENVYKGLRQNHRRPKEERRPTMSVVFEASREIRASILHATFIIIVAFIPLFFLSGMEGRMLKPLGYAYIISLLMSLFIAMTLTPLLCQLMLSSDRYLSKKEKESPVSRFLNHHYTNSLRWVMRHKLAVIIPSILLFIISTVLFFSMGQGFLPEFNEGALTISAVAQPGVSLEEKNKLGNLIEEELLAIPEVRTTARRTGRGELDEHSQTTNSAEIDVNFTLGKRNRNDFLEEVRDRLNRVPGIAFTVGQPLGHRIDHMLSGTRANIAIKLFGDDLSTLYMQGNKIKQLISTIDGVVDANVEQQTETPELQIRADRVMCARYGVTIEHLNNFIEQAFSEKKIADIYEGQRRFDLIMKLNDNYTETADQMRSALIETASGKKVPLEEVTEIVSVGGANSISRENVQRRIIISANVAGRDLKSVVNDIEKTISEKIVLPEGYFLNYGGLLESAEKASQTLFLTSLVAILVIFLLLYMEFKNSALASIILLNLPLALIGGVLVLAFTTFEINIPVIIGFITLFGIATRNGILLVSKYQHLKEEQMDVRERIIYGSTDRLNPILMTALTAALALIPLVLNGSKPGNEIQSPMAMVVLGGLVTSTLLNIYLIPIAYELFEKRKKNNKN